MMGPTSTKRLLPTQRANGKRDQWNRIVNPELCYPVILIFRGWVLPEPAAGAHHTPVLAMEEDQIEGGARQLAVSRIPTFIAEWIIQA